MFYETKNNQMLKTIPQLQIDKNLGNSHLCESIPRQKFGESNQQHNNNTGHKTRIENPTIEGLEKNENQNKVEQTLNDFFNLSNCLHAICAFEEDLK